MRVGFRNVPRFQEGGPMPGAEGEEMPVEGNAPMEQGGPEGGAPEGGDPLMEIAQMAMQALQSQDCQAAMQVCDAFVQLVQQAQGGGAPAEQGEPVYRKGGILVNRIRK